MITLISNTTYTMENVLANVESLSCDQIIVPHPLGLFSYHCSTLFTSGVKSEIRKIFLRILKATNPYAQITKQIIQYLPLLNISD